MGRLRLRVTPGARKEEIAGWHGESLRVRVRERPQKGHANEALIRLLARRLGIPRTRVNIVSGAVSREKVVEVDGLSDEELRSRLGPAAL